MAWFGAAALAVAGLGLVHLFFPLGWDQSLYMTGAKAMADGSTLYVDFWNNKQPGVFLFYWTAGRLFGFTEAGLHAFELVWMAPLCLALAAGVRPWLRHPWLAALAPVAVVGTYYATINEGTMTQPEVLVALPTWLAVWLVARDHGSPRRMAAAFLASGACAAVTVTFKLILAPLFVVLWLVVTVDLLARRKVPWARVMRDAWLPAAAGVVAVLAAVTAGFWLAGALEPMLWASFVWPLEALEAIRTAARSRLLRAAAWLVAGFAPWLLFAAVGIVTRSRLALLMVAWIAAAVALILVQSLSWWDYHMLLLFPPIGVLAVLGIDRSVGFIGDRAGGPGAVVPLVATVLALTLASTQLTPFLTKARPLIGATLVDHQGTAAYQRVVSDRYKAARGVVGLLMTTDDLPGSVFVYGDPLIQFMLDRKPAPAASGMVNDWWPKPM